MEKNNNNHVTFYNLWSKQVNQMTELSYFDAFIWPV